MGMNIDSLKCLIDLHIHLDGSVSVPMARKLADISGVDLGTVSNEQLKTRLSVQEGCQNLNEYLEKFDFPLSLLQTSAAITECVRMLIKEQEQDGVMYSEIRFAPQRHTNNGLTQLQVVEAAIKGLDESDMHKLILCCMRGDNNKEENMLTVEMAHTFLGKGVVALDLAGAEGIYPTNAFKGIFSKAAAYNIPFTIHAGEADGSISIWDALDMGAKRIGHGIRSAFKDEYSNKVIERLKRENIPLELCPTSNLNTKVVESIKEYPIKKLINEGVIVTINTDNRMVSDTSIKKELKLLKGEAGIDDKTIAKLLINSAQSVFAPDYIKERLKNNIYKELDGITYE